MFKIKLLLLTAFGLSSFVRSDATFLTLDTSGFASNEGQAVVYIFREKDAIPSSPFMVLTEKIHGGRSVFKITNLSYGAYAVILLHDKNSNGQIDHSFGIPSEPLGYSNNWKLGPFSGMPTFEKLRFDYTPASAIQSIAISYKKK